MPLTRPNLISPPAFDATKSYTFVFLQSGSSSQIVGNTLTIKRNDTLETVYSQTETTFRYAHTVLENTLQNGTYYTATLTTMDSTGETSPESNAVQFYCFSTPTIEFTNIRQGGDIESGTFNFQVSYNQAQNELLNVYVFNLYGASGELLSTSGNLYVSQSTLPITLAYTFTGFNDNSQYGVEVSGQTIHGMQVSTGRILFNTSFTTASVYSVLTLTNNCSGGYVQIKSNVSGIPGISNGEPILKDGYVELLGDTYVEWNQGFTLDGDWTAMIWGKSFTPDSVIMQMSSVSDGSLIQVYWAKNYAYIRVIPFGFTYGYTIRSNDIRIDSATLGKFVLGRNVLGARDDNQIFIGIRRINNIYSIQVENIGGAGS